RLLINAGLSLAVAAICVAYSVHDVDFDKAAGAIRATSFATVALYLATLAVTHLFRAWRWEFLLRALGTSLPFGRLLLISSVGFMAILGLPFRLGEVVRPYYVAREGHSRISTMLGAVAVERIIDGLLISLLFFCATFAPAGDVPSRELRFAAWLSLGGFLALTVFIVAAQIWTEATIAFALRVTLVRRLAPAHEHRLADKLRAMISGFRALRDHKNFGLFLLQSVVYWGVNGFGMWLLARRMELPISLGAAYTTMAFTGVMISLPNAPGLVGQYHAAIKLGLLAYLPAEIVNTRGIAYAIVLHGIQALWYIGTGLAAMVPLSRTGTHTTLREAVRETALDDGGAERPAT
ncbi:MAG TPA: lysylphosphatidylglycerol synthase transmembrane domain-containing protein, partial [Polyangia bacterium]